MWINHVICHFPNHLTWKCLSTGDREKQTTTLQVTINVCHIQLWKICTLVEDIHSGFDKWSQHQMWPNCSCPADVNLLFQIPFFALYLSNHVLYILTPLSNPRTPCDKSLETPLLQQHRKHALFCTSVYTPCIRMRDQSCDQAWQQTSQSTEFVKLVFWF